MTSSQGYAGSKQMSHKSTKMHVFTTQIQAMLGQGYNHSNV